MTQAIEQTPETAITTAPAVALSAAQRQVLAMALDDATLHRALAFSSRCGRCDRLSPGLCAEHAADLDRVDDYLDLAAQLVLAL